MEPLLDLLKSNARISNSDLAKALNLTEAEVASRIEKLEQEGVIVGYQALFDPEKTGNGIVEAIIEVKITPERGGGFNRLAARISNFEEVQSCYLMSGGYDLLIVVQGKSLQSIAKFIAERLSTIKGVLSTATHFRLKAYKEKGMFLHRETKPERLAVAP